jgi:hypothetical protein
MASDATTVPTGQPVDEFLAGVEPARRREEALVLRDLFAERTGAPPVMWGPSIIGYGQYHYRYDSGREGDFLICGFSPRKTRHSLYLMPGYGAYDGLIARLGKHKTGAACVYVNKLDDIDLDVLGELVTACWEKMRRDYPEV